MVILGWGSGVEMRFEIILDYMRSLKKIKNKVNVFIINDV